MRDSILISDPLAEDAAIGVRSPLVQGRVVIMEPSIRFDRDTFRSLEVMTSTSHNQEAFTVAMFSISQWAVCFFLKVKTDI